MCIRDSSGGKPYLFAIHAVNRQGRSMLKRTHQKDDAASVAIYSDCERYRYSLTRVWDETGGRVHFVMLNPSTATEVQNDPTVERCERRARALGYGAFCVTNIFAWRDTDPKQMRVARDPIGPANDAAILDACDWADVTVACLLYTSPSPRDLSTSRMPSSA